MRATAPPDSVPVRSMTRALNGGTATSAPATPKLSSRNRPVARQAARTVQCAGAGAAAGAGAGAKSTEGGLEIAASFSTGKLALVLSPNIIAVKLTGKERMNEL